MSAFKDLIDERGGPEAVAKDLIEAGFFTDRSNIYHWLRHGVPAYQVPRVARHFGVAPEVVNPRLYGETAA